MVLNGAGWWFTPHPKTAYVPASNPKRSPLPRHFKGRRPSHGRQQAKATKRKFVECKSGLPKVPWNRCKSVRIHQDSSRMLSLNFNFTCFGAPALWRLWNLDSHSQEDATGSGKWLNAWMLRCFLAKSSIPDVRNSGIHRPRKSLNFCIKPSNFGVLINLNQFDPYSMTIIWHYRGTLTRRSLKFPTARLPVVAAEQSWGKVLLAIRRAFPSHSRVDPLDSQLCCSGSLLVSEKDSSKNTTFCDYRMHFRRLCGPLWMVTWQTQISFPLLQPAYQ